MKNHQIKEHCQRLRGKQEGKVRDPEKNTKYQPERKKGGRGRGKGPPGRRKTLQEEREGKEGGVHPETPHKGASGHRKQDAVERGISAKKD